MKQRTVLPTGLSDLVGVCDNFVIFFRIMEAESNNTELGDKKSYAGIPEAEFVVRIYLT